MQATEVLKSEHRVIERVLGAFDQGIQRLENGEPMDLHFYRDAVAFFKGFADGCHHQKEEKVLFVSMVEHGIPKQNGPVGAMLSEHEMGRSYLREIGQAIDRIEAGDLSAKDNLLKNGHGYITLLQQHILKEDQILFPLADRVIPEMDQDKVWQGFNSIEHEEVGEGLHEKYLSLAQNLENEIFIKKS